MAGAGSSNEEGSFRCPQSFKLQKGTGEGPVFRDGWRYLKYLLTIKYTIQHEGRPGVRPGSFCRKKLLTRNASRYTFISAILRAECKLSRLARPSCRFPHHTERRLIYLMPVCVVFAPEREGRARGFPSLQIIADRGVRTVSLFSRLSQDFLNWTT